MSGILHKYFVTNWHKQGWVFPREKPILDRTAGKTWEKPSFSRFFPLFTGKNWEKHGKN